MSLKDFQIDKPFEGFKWRWMEFNPEESLNKSDIFLGIVRAVGACEGLSASSAEFKDKLIEVQFDLEKSLGNVNLVPPKNDRNIIRRQGRYWFGTGVLDRGPSKKLQLTGLGKHLADGRMTVDEFVTNLIFWHRLPNEYVENNATVELWRDKGLTIYPLLIIMKVLRHLSGSVNQCYLTPDEVERILVPLSILGHQLKSDQFVDAILEYRDNRSAAAHFPNCTPKSNDARMVREHLLFLKNFGVLRLEPKVSDKKIARQEEKYFVDELGWTIFDSFEFGEYISDNPFASGDSGKQVGKDIPHLDVDFGATRHRILALVTSRPSQAKFRREVISAYDGKCILTGESILDVVDACHIIDYSNGGPDIVQNSLCLRTDLHTLFDRGKLRISKDSEVVLSDDLLSGSSYSSLQGHVDLPYWVDRNFLDRKFKYGSTSI